MSLPRINISVERDVHRRFSLLRSILEIDAPIHETSQEALLLWMDSKRDEVATKHPTFLPKIFPESAAVHDCVSKRNNATTQRKTRVPKTHQGKAEARNFHHGGTENTKADAVS